MTIFKIKIDNTIDIITNSSSELFILNGDNLETVKEMVSSVYHDWMNEYELIPGSEATADHFDNVYLFYNSSFKPIEGISPENLYSNYNERFDSEWVYPEFSKEGIKLLQEKNKNTFYLFSINENPNYDKQEELEMIGRRIHLG